MKAHKLIEQGNLLTLGQGLLGDLSVSQPTLKDYLQRVAHFWLFVDEGAIPAMTTAELDLALCRFADHLFMEGELASEGEKLKAAMEAVYPDYARAGALGLPRFVRSLKGWRKRAPGAKRLPLPEECLDVVTETLLNKGKLGMFLWLHLTFSCYLRPSEAHGLAVGDVIAPFSPGAIDCGHTSLIICPLERSVSTKTNTFDEAVMLDDARAPWLGPALLRYKRYRSEALRARRLTPAEVAAEPLWDFTPAQLLRAFQEAASQAGLLWLCETLYVCRHGGASRDVLSRARSLLEVQRRGRWGHMDSVKHYEKHARLQWILHQVGSATALRGRRARQAFAARLHEC
jgi:hypothetical protein